MQTEVENVTALVLVEELTPMQLFAPGALNPILERIKAEVRAIETDISTDAGRKEIASVAYKIARTKTFIETQRLALVADEKKRIAAIDTEGRRVREELDSLKEEFRKPLTDWENAERSRVAENEKRIAVMNTLAMTTFQSIDQVQIARAALDFQFNHNFQEFTKRAVSAQDRALVQMISEEKRIAQEEADRVERERLRAESEEKARIDRDAKIAADAKAKADEEAKRREDALAAGARQREEELARAAAEEKTRLEREKAASEARLKKSLDEAKAKAKRAEEERLLAEKRTEEEKTAARERAEADRERAVAEERRRQEDIRRKEEADRAAADKERARREADREHRQKIHAAAVIALVEKVPTLTSPQARDVIKAIVQGLVPAVSINY